jgi:hypothetical protein
LEPPDKREKTDAGIRKRVRKKSEKTFRPAFQGPKLREISQSAKFACFAQKKRLFSGFSGNL